MKVSLRPQNKTGAENGTVVYQGSPTPVQRVTSIAVQVVRCAIHQFPLTRLRVTTPIKPLLSPGETLLTPALKWLTCVDSALNVCCPWFALLPPPAGLDWCLIFGECGGSVM